MFRLSDIGQIVTSKCWSDNLYEGATGDSNNSSKYFLIYWTEL